MSIIGGLLAILFAPPFLHDYWHPTYTLPLWSFGGIEDFIYGFFIVGIASVVYEELFGKKFVKRKGRKKSFSRFVLPALALYGLAFYLPVYLGLPSIYAALFSFAVLASVIVSIRHDLLMDALVSGLVVGSLTLLGFILFLKIYPAVVNRFWDLDGVNSLDLQLGHFVSINSLDFSNGFPLSNIIFWGSLTGNSLSLTWTIPQLSQ